MRGAAGEDSAHFARCARLSASVSQRCGARRAGYPARAPNANEICRHATMSGVARGRRRTMQRTEHTT